MPAGRARTRLARRDVVPSNFMRYVAAYRPGRVHRAVPPNQNRQVTLRPRMAARDQACSRPSVLLRQSVRMGLNRRMGEKLRDRRRICSEDDEKKASGQSQVLPKIPEQRARLTGA